MSKISKGGKIGVGMAAGVFALGLPVAAPVWSVSRSFLRVADRVSQQMGVALTFDDGPHPEATPRALDLLSALGVTATFFLVGEQVRRRPRLAAEIAARGHAIGMHSYDHSVVTRLTPSALREDLDRTSYIVGDAVGRQVTLYRPPRGVFTYSALAMVARRGWLPVLWRVDGRDWRRTATAATIQSRIVRRVREKDIILLHDSDFYSAPGSWRDTLEALPGLIKELSRLGLQPAGLRGH